MICGETQLRVSRGTAFGCFSSCRVRSYRLWVMLVEWESFSCFGMVERVHRIPGFIVTNKIHGPREALRSESPDFCVWPQMVLPRGPSAIQTTMTRPTGRKTEQVKTGLLAEVYMP